MKSYRKDQKCGPYTLKIAQQGPLLFITSTSSLMLIHIYLLSAIIIHRNWLLIAFISEAEDKNSPGLSSY